MNKLAARVAFRHLTKTAYLDTTDNEQHELVLDLLLLSLAMLRAQHWLLWNTHWTVRGENFYQLHLLFQRLYDEDGLDDEIDTLAEKIVGFFGSAAIDPKQQMFEAAGWLDRWCKKSEDPILRALAAEEHLQEVLSQVYEAIENQGVMTMGLDDFIMALASRHETAQYLLQQSMPVMYKHPNKQASEEPAAPSAEGVFFDSPRKKVVREFAESGAPTNVPEVAKDSPDREPGDVAKARKAPPTPTEIAENPGGEQFSTLNQYVVTTEEPVPPSVPDSRDEIKKHPDIK